MVQSLMMYLSKCMQNVLPFASTVLEIGSTQKCHNPNDWEILVNHKGFVSQNFCSLQFESLKKCESTKRTIRSMPSSYIMQNNIIVL